MFYSSTINNVLALDVGDTVKGCFDSVEEKIALAIQEAEGL